MATIVVILLCLNGFILGFIERTSTEMLDELQTAVSLMNAGDQQALLRQINAMQDQWSQDEERWESCVDHEDVEKINITLTRLNAMAEGGTLDIMPAEMQELAFLLNHLVEQHRLKWENIF